NASAGYAAADGWNATAASCAASASLILIFVALVRSSAAARFAAPVEGAADAHVHGECTGAVAIIAGNKLIAGTRIVEAGATRRIRGAVRIELSKCRPFVVLAIEIRVLSRRNIEGRAAVRHDEWIED